MNKPFMKILGAVSNISYDSEECSIQNDEKNITAEQVTGDTVIAEISEDMVEESANADEKLDPQYLEFKSTLKLDSSEEDEEYGEFEGYASVFNNVDLGNDVIKQGAFRKSLKARGHLGVKLLYQHKSDMPIGVFDEIKEDEHGLYVKGRLALKSTAGRDAYELLKMGALDGMSIGFRPNPKEITYDKRSKKRMIGEVDLMEISLVTFPMNPKATVLSVKANVVSIREWENGLRDAFNLSRSEAKVAAKAVHQAFESKEASETLAAVEDNTDLANAIKQFTLTLTR